MIVRSRLRAKRLVATAAASILALSATSLAVSASGEGAGWAVDTSGCPDRVNEQIEDEILIGGAMPLSGGPAAAAFSPVAQGFEAYIDYANRAEIVPGMTLVADIRDDQYNPGLTPGVVDGLLDDGAHLFAGLIGTGGVLSVRDTVNEECVPTLNVLTGDPRWGEAAEDYPWLTGMLTSYRLESEAYAENIAELFPDATVGLFFVHNEFGQVYMDAFREAAADHGVAVGEEQTVEDGDESPPQAQLNALADSRPDVIMATPLGAQCVSFLNELANQRAVHDGWDPVVYITNTCAAPLILAVAGENADGIYTSAPMGLMDIDDPANNERLAGYIFEMAGQGLDEIRSVGGAGWNVAEVTVEIIRQAAESPDGLTQASIINASRNLNYRPTLLRDGMRYTMNGPDDAFYSEDLQIVTYSVADGHFHDVGEPYSYESTPDADDPVEAEPIG